MVNMAAKRRYTTILEHVDTTSTDSETYTEETKKPAAYTTINGDIIESFAFHSALIGIAIFIGRLIVWGVDTVFQFSLPLFPFAMIGGFLLNQVLQRTKLGALMDRATFQRIQGLAMEFLIVAAVASVSIPVVLEYWQPLLVSCAALSLTTMGIFWFVSPKIYKKHWFECGIVRYGTATGVAAIGLMLLRTVDPEMKTEGGKVYALSTPFTSAFIGGGLVSTAYPFLIADWGALKCGLLFTALSAACILVCALIGFWNRDRVKEQRGNLGPEAEG
jgi:ESS family glutamate:Na+ symporter